MDRPARPGNLLGAVLLTVLFVAAERRSAAPLVPLRIFASRSFIGGNLMTALFAMAAFGTGTTVSAYA